MPRSSSSTKSPAIRPSVPPPRFTSPLAPSIPTAQSPSFGQVMKEGFAFGVGSSLARNVVDSFLGRPAVAVPQQPSQLPPSRKSCAELEAEFNACLQAHLPEHTCQDALDRFNQCKQ